MRGQYSGFTKCLSDISPSQIYVWCYAHVLNLIIIQASKISNESINLFDLLNAIGIFFTRMDVWRNTINVIKDSRMISLIGQTRWWARDTALKKVFDSYNKPQSSAFVELVDTLHNISSSCTGEDNDLNFSDAIRGKASNLLQNLCKFETILTAQLYLRLFQSTSPLSKFLQTSGIDILVAHRMVSETKYITCSVQKIRKCFNYSQKVFHMGQ